MKKILITLLSLLHLSCFTEPKKIGQKDISLTIDTNEIDNKLINQHKTYNQTTINLNRIKDSISEIENKKQLAINWLNEKFGSNVIIEDKQYYSFVCFLSINNDGTFTVKHINKYKPHPEFTLPDTEDLKEGFLGDLLPNSVYTTKVDDIVFFFAKCKICPAPSQTPLACPKN